MSDFKAKLKSAWRNHPPRIEFFTRPMPNTPNLHLTGSGCASTTKIETFIKELERDLHSQSGSYYAYVMGGCKEEADTYFLEGWEILTGDNSVYEYTVIMYYSAVNPYLAIKKWMGEDMAKKHLARKAAISAIENALV
jgi:hypothetical protein